MGTPCYTDAEGNTVYPDYGPSPDARTSDPAPPVAPTAEKVSDDMVAIANFDSKLRLITFTMDGSMEFIDERLNRHGVLYTAFSETLALWAAVRELEELINSRSTKEADLQ